MNISKVLVLAALAPTISFAGEKSAIIETAPAASRWSLGVSFAPLLNVDANFSNIGGFSSGFTPQPLGGGQNYNYDDGFVRVDSSGNALGLTSYWGYSNSSQYNPAGGGTITNSITNSLQSGRAGDSDDFSPGVELFGYYDMGKLADLLGKPVTWGFKAGVHYSKVSIDNSSSVTSDVLRVSDSFSLGGVIPPGAGYEGTANGPGALIGDSPSRTETLIPGGATVDGNRDLDVDLLTLSAGPYIRIPLTAKFSVNAEAGVNLAIAHGDYDYDATTSITGVGTQSTRGDESRTMLLPGLYAGLSASYELTDHFLLYAAARYQYIDQFKVSAAGSQVELNFDGAAVISLGAVWAF